MLDCRRGGDGDVGGVGGGSGPPACQQQPRSLQQHPAMKLRLSKLNHVLLCPLCKGYFVDATTISECLHSFCRSCIVTYVKSNQYCPVCDVQIHKTKPLLNLRPDQTLQSIVYKIVPGLYQLEMRKRRLFYTEEHPEIDTSAMDPEMRGDIPGKKYIYAPDDPISLSLEYDEDESSGGRPNPGGSPARDSLPNGGAGYEDGEDGEPPREEEGHRPRIADSATTPIPVRYFSCPAAVSAQQLKKLLMMKFNLTSEFKVDIRFQGDVLPDVCTLVDVAYAGRWDQEKPIRLTYTISRRRRVHGPPGPKKGRKRKRDGEEERGEKEEEEEKRRERKEEGKQEESGRQEEEEKKKRKKRSREEMEEGAPGKGSGDDEPPEGGKKRKAADEEEEEGSGGAKHAEEEEEEEATRSPAAGAPACCKQERPSTPEATSTTPEQEVAFTAPPPAAPSNPEPASAAPPGADTDAPAEKYTSSSSSSSPLDLSQHSTRPTPPAATPPGGGVLLVSSARGGGCAATAPSPCPASRSPGKRGKGQSTQTILSIAESLAHKQMNNLRKLVGAGEKDPKVAKARPAPPTSPAIAPVPPPPPPRAEGRSSPIFPCPLLPWQQQQQQQQQLKDQGAAGCRALLPAAPKGSAPTSAHSPILFNYITFSQSGEEMCVVGSSTLKGASAAPNPAPHPNGGCQPLPPLRPASARPGRNVLKVPDLLLQQQHKLGKAIRPRLAPLLPQPLRIPSVRPAVPVAGAATPSPPVFPKVSAHIKAVKAPRVTKGAIFRSPIESRLHELIRNQQLVRKQQQAALRDAAASLPQYSFSTGGPTPPAFYRSHANPSVRQIPNPSLLHRQGVVPQTLPKSPDAAEGSPMPICEQVHS